MKRLLILVLITISIPIYLFSATLNVEDAINAAKSNNKDWALKVKQYQDTVAMNNRANSFVPSLNVSMGVGTGGSTFSKAGGWDPTWSGLTYNIGVSSSLSLNGSSFFDKQKKNASNLVASTTLENDEIDLESSVISSYFELVLAKENIKVAENTLNSSIETLENTKERYENGLIPEISVLQAENQVSLNKLSLDNLKANEALLVSSFNNLTGIDFNSYDSFVDLDSIKYLDLPSGEELFERYFATIPALKMLRANMNNTEISYKSAKTAAQAPVFTISGTYRIDGGYKNSISPLAPTSSVGDLFQVNVSMALPISSYFNSNSNKIQLDTLKNTVSDLTTTYYNTADSLKLSIGQMVQLLKNLESQIQNTESSIALLEKTYSLTEDAYNNGHQSYSDLQSVKDTLTSTKYSLLSLKTTYLQNAYTLAQSLGTTLEELGG